MNNCFIILAAGESKRFKSKKPKPYYLFKGKPLFLHSIDRAKESNKFKKIVLVINKKHKRFLRNIRLKNVKIINGGKNRSESSLKGLKSIINNKISKVLIHDAARPNFSLKLISALLRSLKKNKCVVPVIKTNNSVKLKEKNKLTNVDRNKIYLTQTPQAFDYKTLLKLQKKTTSEITDDANLFIEAKKKVKFINGEINNLKITLKSDVIHKNNLKYGIGFDVHRLVPKRKLYLGGIKIPSSAGTLGHSDGDAVLHAITDSILGACKMGDIGEKFSNKNKKYKNIRSTVLLKKVIDQIKFKNYTINNIDINIILQKPKISKFKKRMILLISKICEMPSSQINIKGKTTEKLGLVGKEKAVACEVITSVIKYA